MPTCARIVFCGSGEFAVPSLQEIVSRGYPLAGIFTQPARAAGRGGRMRPTPVFECATAAGLPVTPIENINAPEAVEALRALQPDVLCVADFGQFIRVPARKTARLDAINLHGSLLPELRGAAPINWAILRGFRTTGVTTFSLVDKMDAGDLYLQEAVEMFPSETAEELKARLARVGANLLCRTVDLLAAGEAVRIPQDHALATLAPILKKADGVIDWTADAAAVRDRIHGTWPWPGGQAAFRRAGGAPTPVTIARAAAVEGSSPGGGVVAADLSVGAGRGRVNILEIKPAGKRLMAWRDFVNGYRVAPGDLFTGPTHEPNP